jgi:imidazoleglycerol-phosphate dehydratase
MSPARVARIERVTKESKVRLELDLDGTGRTEVSTGVGFYDHMLSSLAKHALLDLSVEATGDTHVDAHHTVEDVAIVLGQALREALGDKAGIRRFGDALVPLDECLVQAVVDVSGRPYCVHDGEPEGQQYVRVLSGRDPHHIVEAQFKAVARALRAAVEPDPRVQGVPSTKGSL